MFVCLFAGAGTEASAASSPISYSVALYILIGIAAFYSMATLVCCVLVVLNWYLWDVCVGREKGGGVCNPCSIQVQRPVLSTALYALALHAT